MKDSEILLKADIGSLPIFNPNLKTIPVLRKIAERLQKVEGDHDGRKKKQNIKELSFIHLYTHFMLDDNTLNPYWRHSEELRFDKLKKDLDMPEDWDIDNDLRAAMDYYSEAIVMDFDIEALDAVMVAARATLDYWRGVDYLRRDSKGNLLYRPKEVLDSIKQVNGLIGDITAAREKIKSNMKLTANKVRGGGEIGSREVPKS